MPVNIELGLGIIGLGKPWGYLPGDVPSERDALELLAFAWETGIRYFDSAPSYGIAEERLGKFVRSLDAGSRKQLRIATKFGEHWDPLRGEPFVDYSCDALCRSLDASRDRLGRIDVLQLHKTTPQALSSRDVQRAWNYAASIGIRTLGASVSDPESARIVIDDTRYGCIQLPLNCSNEKFAGSIANAARRSMWIAINRPFAMGAMLYGEGAFTHQQAFRCVLRHKFDGVILTGTRSKKHLQENWSAFQSAFRQVAEKG